MGLLLAALTMWFGAWAPASETKVRLLPGDAATGAALVSNAVTVEGTAAVEVTADACRMEFEIAATSVSTSAALENLIGKRDAFTKIVSSATGGRARSEFGEVKVARWEERYTDKDGGRQVEVHFEARQTARARLTDFAKDDKGLETLVTRVASAVGDARLQADGVSGPVMVFEVSRPAVLEEELLAAAVKDAEARKALAAKALGRRLGQVRSAYFPTTVLVDGKTVALGDMTGPLTGASVTFVIKYTVQVAYVLEL